jgi:hypothetical protein
MARELRLSDIVLPEKASLTKKLQSLAVSASRTGGNVAAERVLLYGLMGIVARLEAAAEHDANLRKALEDIFPESMEGS